MITKKGSFNFKKTRKKYDKFKREIPKILANEAANHFLDGFKKGGGQTDLSRSGWKPRRPARSQRQSRRNAGRALLVQSGNMRGDLRARQISFRRTVVNIIHVKYAIIHNEGRGRMPQREIIGKSRELVRKNIRTVNRELKKVS